MLLYHYPLKNFMRRDWPFSSIRVRRTGLCSQDQIPESFGKDQRLETKTLLRKFFNIILRLFTSLGFVNYEALECFVTLKKLIDDGEL